MILKVYSPRGLGSIITVNFKEQKVSVENFTDSITDTAFGVNLNPTMDDLDWFLKDRCVPETRHNLKYYLQEIGVQCFDPISIIRKTKGRMAEDDLWVEIID